jgi:pyruvate/2-oxoacid:ferredoxin oxidoreductase alpha subunit
MHGVIPYRPSRPTRSDQIAKLLPLIGFALLPVAVIFIAAAVEAHGLPTSGSLSDVIVAVGASQSEFEQ